MLQLCVFLICMQKKKKWQSKKRKLDRVGFLGDYVMAFTNEIHTDVTVKPGDNGPGILAHKSVLVISLNLNILIYILCIETKSSKKNRSIDVYITIDYVRLNLYT